MKIKIYALVVSVLIGHHLASQDIIVFKNGDEIQAKIKEVTPTSVVFLKYDNLEGPSYTEFRANIFMLKYQNGTKDVFKDVAPENTEALVSIVPAPPIDNSKNNDKIITTRGETIECVIDNVTKSEIYYHIIRQGRDHLGILSLSEVSSFSKNSLEKKVEVITSPQIIDEEEIIPIRKYGGPRIGTTVAGDGALSKALEAEGKRNVFTQFGWQFEKRVFTLKNGLSGMLEFVPMIGGLDMGKFIPSASAFIGLRTKEGIEFGAGPNVAFFHGKDIYGGESTTGNVGVIIAAGFSLRSGKVYFPVNIALVPSVTKQASYYDMATHQTVVKQYQTGMKVTLTVGFNSRKK